MVAETLLVVDSDSARATRLVDVLTFIDYGSVVALAPEAEWEPTQEATAVRALFLGVDGSQVMLNHLLQRIDAWGPGVPLFIYGAAAAERKPDGVIFGRLDMPPRYHQLIRFLHQAQAVQRARQQQRPVTTARELVRSLVGVSSATQEVRHLIGQVADSEANVLILGESGTGKEVVARSLHQLSSRRDHPFIPVNCGAIPGELLESELFGHEKGAFTGAISARQGRFELAAGGTLFLDEIGDMPLPMQVKLLRVLQERTFERVGSNRSVQADVRIVAATHRDLENNINDGRFREDLYYRLNVFPIEMSPLRERSDDVPLLIHEFISRLEREERGSVRLTETAMESLSRYPWPGNVRELANLVERLVIMYPYGVVDYNDLPAKFRMDGIAEDELCGADILAIAARGAPPREEPLLREDPVNVDIDLDALPGMLPLDGIDLKEYIGSMEMGLIQQALEEADGVVAHAAKRLRLRRTTLVEKMRKYGLNRDSA